jgi:hypothetical protein
VLIVANLFKPRRQLGTENLLRSRIISFAQEQEQADGKVFSFEGDAVD